MSWTEIALLPGHSSAAAIASQQERCYLRGSSHISAVDMINHRELWRIELEGDHAFGYKPLILIKGVLITVVHHSGLPHPMWLTAVGVDDGNLLWERQVNWGLHEYWGGIIHDGESITYFEPIADGISMTQLDPVTSSIRYQQTYSSDYGETPSRALLFLNNWLYFLDNEGSLGRVSLSGEAANREKLISGPINVVANSDYELHCLESAVDKWLTIIDARTGKGLSRFEIDAKLEVRSIVPISVGNNRILVLQLQPGQGLAAISAETGELLWRIGGDKSWTVSRLAATPAGISIFTSPVDEDGLLLQIKPLSGEIEIIADNKIEIWFGMIHWTGSELIADGINGLHFFRPYPANNVEPKMNKTSNDKKSEDRIQGESAQSTYDDTDLAFSDIIDMFVRAMAAGRGSEEHRKQAELFNTKLDNFLNQHPEASLANFAQGLVQLGVPYDQAMTDLVYMRNIANQEKG